jgi:hypothetical protein
MHDRLISLYIAKRDDSFCMTSAAAEKSWNAQRERAIPQH